MTNFFYQALQRAAGKEIPAEPEAPAVQAAAPEVEAAPATAIATLEAPAPGRVDLPKAAKRLRLHGPIPYMVASNTQPISPANVPAMEQVRLLRTRLLQVMRTRKLRTVMVTSALPSEGKTLLAVNLAFSMSQVEGKRVLLVDADLRRPTVARFLNTECHDGLSEYLCENRPLPEITYEVKPNLHVVMTSPVEDSVSMITGPRMHSFLRESQNYDLIVIDAPPIFPIADAEAMLSLVDGAIMVVRAHQTPYELAKQAANRLHNKAVGVVLNCSDKSSHPDYYYQSAKPGKKSWLKF